MTTTSSPAVHQEAHTHGDPEAWLMDRYGIDARALAGALWAARGDPAALQRAIYREHDQARMRMMP